MPIIHDEGIVLKTVATGEADLVVHLLLAERGRRTAFARAARQSRKRYAGALRPFCHLRGTFTLKRTAPLYQLNEAECLDSYPALGDHLGRYYLASYFLDLLDAWLMDGETYPEAYALIRYFLDRLAQGEPSLAHRLFFELRLMNLLGVCPDIETDEEEEPAHRLWFDPLSGDYAPTNVPMAHLVPLSAAARRLIAAVIAAPLETLPSLRVSAAQAREALRLTRALIDQGGTRRLPTLAFVDEAFAPEVEPPPGEMPALRR